MKRVLWIFLFFIVVDIITGEEDRPRSWTDDDGIKIEVIKKISGKRGSFSSTFKEFLEFIIFLN